MTAAIARREAASPAYRQYTREIADHPLLDADRERELAEAARRGDPEAARRLVECNLRLVARIARGFLGRGLPLEDLVAEGNLGLFRAVGRFDPAFGARFATYAAFWVKHAIRQALVDWAPAVRVPLHTVNLLRRWRRAERGLAAASGEAPDRGRVAGALGLTAAQREMVERALRAAALGAGSGGADFEAEAEGPAPWEPLEARDERRELERRLGRLDERERAVVTLRFGLDGLGERTLAEVGRRIGATREWARKLEVRALRKLRSA